MADRPHRGGQPSGAHPARGGARRWFAVCYRSIARSSLVMPRFRCCLQQSAFPPNPPSDVWLELYFLGWIFCLVCVCVRGGDLQALRDGDYDAAAGDPHVGGAGGVRAQMPEIDAFCPNIFGTGYHFLSFVFCFCCCFTRASGTTTRVTTPSFATRTWPLSELTKKKRQASPCSERRFKGQRVRAFDRSLSPL